MLGSGDGGRTWRLLSQNIEPSFEVRLRDMIVGPDGRLYAAGLGRNVNDVPIYRTVDPVAVASAAPPEASGASLHNAPNPASGATTIRLTLPSPEAEVGVFDARGREVWSASGARGQYVWEVDTSTWAAGVYVVRAEVGGEVLSAQMTVVR